MADKSYKITLEADDKGLKATLAETAKAVKSTDAAFDKAGSSAAQAGASIAKSATTAVKSMKASSSQISKIGKNISSVFTGIATAAASIGIAVKQMLGFVNDFSALTEANTKLEQTFRGVESAARSAVNELTTSYGLARGEATALLASTGDILTGFGMERQAALALSSEIQRLSVDLASFQNLQGGARQASEALTKAILGERESAKMLGIVLRETDVQQRIISLSAQKYGIALNSTAEITQKLSGEQRMQLQALATMQLAMEQSRNAVGDFARTQEGFANQSRILGARVSDLSTRIGEGLQPAFAGALRVLTPIVQAIAGLPTPLLAAGAAAITLTVSIGGITTAIGFLASAGIPAFIALQTSMGAILPIMLAVAGAAALFVGLASALDTSGRAVQQMKDAVDELGRTTQELTRINAQLERGYTNVDGKVRKLTQTERDLLEVKRQQLEAERRLAAVRFAQSYDEVNKKIDEQRKRIEQLKAVQAEYAETARQGGNVELMNVNLLDESTKELAKAQSELLELQGQVAQGVNTYTQIASQAVEKNGDLISTSGALINGYNELNGAILKNAIAQKFGNTVKDLSISLDDEGVAVSKQVTGVMLDVANAYMNAGGATMSAAQSQAFFDAVREKGIALTSAEADAIRTQLIPQLQTLMQIQQGSTAGAESAAPARKATRSAIDERKRLLQEIDALNDTEEDRINKKYDALVAKARKYKLDTTEIEQARLADLTTLQDDYEKERERAFAESRERIANARAARLREYDAFLGNERQLAIQDVREKSAELLRNEALTQEQRLKVIEEARKKENEITARFLQEAQNKRKQAEDDFNAIIASDKSDLQRKIEEQRTKIVEAEAAVRSAIEAKYAEENQRKAIEQYDAEIAKIKERNKVSFANLEAIRNYLAQRAVADVQASQMRVTAPTIPSGLGTFQLFESDGAVETLAQFTKRIKDGKASVDEINDAILLLNRYSGRGSNIAQAYANDLSQALKTYKAEVEKLYPRVRDFDTTVKGSYQQLKTAVEEITTVTVQRGDVSQEQINKEVAANKELAAFITSTQQKIVNLRKRYVRATDDLLKSQSQAEIEQVTAVYDAAIQSNEELLRNEALLTDLEIAEVQTRTDRLKSIRAAAIESYAEQIKVQLAEALGAEEEVQQQRMQMEVRTQEQLVLQYMRTKDKYRDMTDEQLRITKEFATQSAAIVAASEARKQAKIQENVNATVQMYFGLAGEIAGAFAGLENDVISAFANITSKAIDAGSAIAAAVVMPTNPLNIINAIGAGLQFLVGVANMLFGNIFESQEEAMAREVEYLKITANTYDKQLALKKKQLEQEREEVLASQNWTEEQRVAIVNAYREKELDAEKEFQERKNALIRNMEQKRIEQIEMETLRRQEVTLKKQAELYNLFNLSELSAERKKLAQMTKAQRTQIPEQIKLLEFYEAEKRKQEEEERKQALETYEKATDLEKQKILDKVNTDAQRRMLEQQAAEEEARIAKTLRQQMYQNELAQFNFEQQLALAKLGVERAQALAEVQTAFGAGSTEAANLNNLYANIEALLRSTQPPSPPSYFRGMTNTRTGLAMLHRGERVIPSHINRVMNGMSNEQVGRAVQQTTNNTTNQNTAVNGVTINVQQLQNPEEFARTLRGYQRTGARV